MKHFPTDVIRAGFENDRDLYISLNGVKKTFWMGQQWIDNLVTTWIKNNLADDWGDEYVITGFQDVKNQIEISFTVTGSGRYFLQEFTFLESFETIEEHYHKIYTGDQFPERWKI